MEGFGHLDEASRMMGNCVELGDDSLHSVILSAKKGNEATHVSGRSGDCLMQPSRAQVCIRASISLCISMRSGNRVHSTSIGSQKGQDDEFYAGIRLLATEPITKQCSRECFRPRSQADE